MRAVDIARAAHEVNRAYCQSLWDNSQPTWGDAPEWQRQSALKGVEFHLANPQAGPGDSHNEWLKEKAATGWKYGPVKDPVAKEHPCCVPYHELPQAQRAKDYIFRAVVHALHSELTADQAVKAVGPSAPRVTPYDVLNAIVSETYTILPGGRTTICELTLRNGFTVRGESSCVSIENFDAEIGKRISREDARQKIWQLLGYQLRERLSLAEQAEKDRL